MIQAPPAWEESASDESLIQFVDHLLKDAELKRASDIHIEPLSLFYRIRYRIDGLLQPANQISPGFALRVILRLKIMAELDISEKRLPQDGRFAFQSTLDIRISVCPVLHGEKIVLRLLDSNQQVLCIEHLGFTENQQKLFIDKISQKQGLILITGPTGSGKTLTLYSALQYLNSLDKNIITLEDPIEIQLDGINQTAIKPKIGLDFAQALRAMLRQDPDVIMIGEIRDSETATIALQAAQTGHLVLSSLHASSTIDAIYRLMDLGCHSSMLINALSLILGQRLVRKKCTDCDTGCAQCSLGYQGRTAIFECLPMSETLSSAIFDKTNKHLLHQKLRQEGFLNLKEIGFQKIKNPEITAAELQRALPD